MFKQALAENGKRGLLLVLALAAAVLVHAIVIIWARRTPWPVKRSQRKARTARIDSTSVSVERAKASADIGGTPAGAGKTGDAEAESPDQASTSPDETGKQTGAAPSAEAPSEAKPDASGNEAASPDARGETDLKEDDAQDESTEVLMPEPGSLHGNIALQRSARMRNRALKRYCGPFGTERVTTCTTRALAWLAEQQTRGGNWIPFPDAQPGSPGAQANNYTVGLTSLALLAFAAEGNSASEGPYSGSVTQGLNYLLSCQQDTGCFFPLVNESPEYTMLNHVLATCAVGELHLMERKEKTEIALASAVRYLLLSQQHTGGWDGKPTYSEQVDVVITSWAAEALSTAAMADIEIPARLPLCILLQLDSATLANGLALAKTSAIGLRQESTDASVPATCMAAMARLQMGYRPDVDKIEGVAQKIYAQFRRESPSRWDHTSICSATQVMFTLGGQMWERWRRRVVDTLIANQRDTGRELGSWPASRDEGARMGSTWATALNTLALQTCYRFPRESAGRSQWVVSSLRARWRKAGPMQKKWLLRTLLDMDASAADALKGIYPEVEIPELREQVLRHIASHSSDPAQSIAPYIKTADGRLAAEAVPSLMDMGAAGLPELTNGWHTLEDDSLRHKVVKHIANHQKELDDEFVKRCVTDTSPFIRIFGAQEMVKSGNLEVIPVLAKLAGDANPYIRQLAIEESVKLQDRQAWHIVIDGLMDPEPAICAHCLNHLRRRAGTDFGFLPTATPEKKAEAIERWKRWLEQEVFPEKRR